MPLNKVIEDAAYSEALEHVDWFLGAIRPLLLDQFRHGFKHGMEYVASVLEPEKGGKKDDE